jgi:hypothetical protein
MFRRFAPLAALGSMTRGGDKPADPGLVSFHRQVLTILQRKCHGSHQPAKPNGKLKTT